MKRMFTVGFGEEYEGDGFTEQPEEEFAVQQACERAVEPTHNPNEDL